MLYPGFINGSYTSQSALAAIERTVNFYPEIMESDGAATRLALYPTPGVTQFGSTPTENPVRGIWEGGGRMLAVVGGLLKEYTADGVSVTRGSVDNDNTVVTFATNGDAGGEVMISSGGTGYVFTLATNILTSVVTDVHFVGYLDGFFLGLDVSTSTLRISDLLDGTTWSVTQLAQRNVASDNWVSMIVNNREIWLFGTKTTEVWYNSGASPYPFTPIDGAFLEHGIAAARSVAILAGQAVWLSANENGSGIVRRAEGWRGVRISNHSLEFAIQGYNTISDAVGWAYEQNGHEFYILEFPTAGKTWAYDAVTNIWCERSSWDSTNGLETAWRARHHVYAFGKHLVGDRTTGRLFEMSLDYYTDVDSGLIRRVRRAPHLGQELQRIRYRQFKLDLETGVGLSSGQGSDPTVMMRYSDDGGKTWGPELWRSAGAIGEYETVVQWDALGQARRRVFEVSVTDPIPWRIMNAYLEVY